jgi:hypothetical protein
VLSGRGRAGRGRVGWVSDQESGARRDSAAVRWDIDATAAGMLVAVLAALGVCALPGCAGQVSVQECVASLRQQPLILWCFCASRSQPTMRERVAHMPCTCWWLLGRRHACLLCVRACAHAVTHLRRSECRLTSVSAPEGVHCACVGQGGGAMPSGPRKACSQAAACADEALCCLQSDDATQQPTCKISCKRVDGHA